MWQLQKGTYPLFSPSRFQQRPWLDARLCKPLPRTCRPFWHQMRVGEQQRGHNAGRHLPQRDHGSHEACARSVREAHLAVVAVVVAELPPTGYPCSMARSPSSSAHHVVLILYGCEDSRREVLDCIEEERFPTVHCRGSYGQQSLKATAYQTRRQSYPLDHAVRPGLVQVENPSVAGKVP